MNKLLSKILGGGFMFKFLTSRRYTDYWSPFHLEMPAGWFIMLLLLSANFFQNQLLKKSFKNNIRVSRRLDPDQDQHFAGPHLAPNCL